MQTTSMRFVALYFFILLVGMWFAYTFGARQQQKAIENNSVATSETSEGVWSGFTNEDLTYSDEKHGFTMTFPQSWIGVKATTSTHPGWDTACFSNTTQGGLPLCLLKVDVFTKSQWTAYQKENRAQYLKYIKPGLTVENEDYVITFDDVLSGRSQEDDFQWKIAQDIPLIYDTFELLH